MKITRLGRELFYPRDFYSRAADYRMTKIGESLTFAKDVLNADES